MKSELPSDAFPSADHRWFDDHVLPHEPLLRAWLRSRFPRGVDLDDLVQESFARVLRARANGAASRGAYEPGSEPSDEASLFVADYSY